MKTRHIILICAIALSISHICSAQKIRIGGYSTNYHTQRVSSDSLDKIFSKRIPEELEVADCTLEDLTEHHWLSVFAKVIVTDGYFIYTFQRNGEYKIESSSMRSDCRYKHTEKRRYYLSDTPALQFDTTKIGNKRGKYIICERKADDETPYTAETKRIFKCADGTLFEIVDDPSLYIFTYKPLKEPYDEVVKRGYLTIPFEEYGFKRW